MAALNTLAGLFANNHLTGFIESFILVFFTGAVVSALVSCMMKPASTGENGNILQRFTAASNFTQASTIVAGLILTAATGVLGTPANVKITAVTTSSAATAPSQAGQDRAQQSQSASASPAVQLIKDPQRDAFKTICAWLYVVLGAICFFTWVIPTPANHDLVRNIGLTTLGFATSIISNLQLPSAQ
ncbi:MAG: hypothetical protein ABSF53_08050 [Terracidiphilus sp.]|jgi:chemotaxis protein CheY-P-specific phosphatase CheC